MGPFEFFREFLYFEGYEQIAALGLAVLFALCAGLRVALHGAYNAAIALTKHGAKSIKIKEDIQKLGSGAFGRTAKEYAALAGRGVKVDVPALAQASIFSNKLLLLNFNSIGSLILALETAFVPLAILLTLAAESTLEFALISATLFIVLRIFGAFFDIGTIKERYIKNLSQTLAKEVGKFFPEDTSAAIYTFGTDLKEYLTRQSAMYSDILIRINSEFANSLKTNVGAMTAGVEATLQAISRESSELQNDTASSITEMHKAAEKMTKTLNEAARFINNSESLEKRNEALEHSLAMTKENQAVLAMSVAQYEASLKEITAQLGDALGKIVGYHLSAANAQIADNIAANLSEAKGANMALIGEIKAVFAELNEQSRLQTQMLMTILKGVSDE
jgi:hypothetical protein